MKRSRRGEEDEEEGLEEEKGLEEEEVLVVKVEAIKDKAGYKIA